MLHSTTHKWALRHTPPYFYGEGNLYAGSPVSDHQSLRTECTYSRTTRSCARSVRSATRRQLSVPQLALRAYPDDRLEDRGGVRPRFVERGHPHKSIITIPITLYGYGNGDNAEEGGPERRRDEREHRERKCDKVRRCSRPARPLGASIAQPPRPRLILPAPPCSVGCSPHALEASVALRSSC